MALTRRALTRRALTRRALTRRPLAHWALTLPVLSGRARQTLAAGLLVWSCPFVAPASHADELADGNAAFDAGRYGEARQVWSAAARAGNANAAFDLGLLYDLGDGVSPNASTAFRWYRRAAEAGIGAGALNVGVMYDSGRGVRRDRAEAAIWYARAASLGQREAAFNLGQLYETGEGVPHNIAAAVAWYSMAAGAIPEAAAKAAQLAAHQRSEVAGPLVAPKPVWPAGGTAVPVSAAHSVTQLVWTAPAEPFPVTYFVELQAGAHGQFNEVLSRYSTTSATAVTLPGDEDFAWRVYAVAADGSGYAPSAWTHFGVAVTAPGTLPRATPR
ncbi:tetratricopeptide repeat protein [Acidisoma sp.]|uniref:tetratricopeptide repeat protein n=1 Tax=Acidisoma sp. TaxID=1872115 RepID=UPI003B00F2E5